MRRIILRREFSLNALRYELAGADIRRVRDGSGEGGWIHGLSNTRLFLRHPKTHIKSIDQLGNYPLVKEAISMLRSEADEHGELTQVMVNVLEPGGELNPHRDGLPDDHRWHLPVLTNAQCDWWDEIDGYTHMAEGEWAGPVPYCGVLHSAVNHGRTKRVHLVADFSKTRNRYL